MSQYKDLINRYSRGDSSSTYDLLKHQKGLLFLLKEIVEACEKHGLKPFIINGNLIGKVRHNGFIPWDDDLDLGLLREDYNKFTEVFEKELSDRYVISAPFKGYKATNRFIQVGRKGTILKDWGAFSDSEDIVTNHIYIDIFPFDYVPNSRIGKKLKGYKCNLLMAIAGAVDFQKNRNKEIDDIFKHSLHGRFELLARIVLGNLFGFKSVSGWMQIVNNAVQNKKETDFMACTVGRAHYFGEILNKNVIVPLKKANYCGVEVYQINCPDIYLKTLYGDYMQVPPPEKRESHHAIKMFIPEEMLMANDK